MNILLLFTNRLPVRFTFNSQPVTGPRSVAQMTSHVFTKQPVPGRRVAAQMISHVYTKWPVTGPRVAARMTSHIFYQLASHWN